MAEVEQSNGHVAPMVNFRRGASRNADADTKRQQQAAVAAAAAKEKAEKAAAAAAKEAADLKAKPSLETLSNGKASTSAKEASKSSPANKKKAATPANGRKPPVPPTERGTADPKGTVLRQQMSGHAGAAQKSGLREAMAALTKDQYQEIAISNMFIDVAVNGESVRARQLTEDKKKPEKPHSIKEVVEDVSKQADSMKLRETSKGVMNDGISHNLSMMYGNMNALNHVGTKDRVRNGPAEAYMAAKESVESVKTYQFTPMEQKEHVTLRVLENAQARVGRTNVKVGQKGPQEISEAEKERNAKLREKILDRQVEVMNGALRDELEKNKEVSAIQDEFSAFLQKKSPDLNEQVINIVTLDRVTAYNIHQVVDVTASSLNSKVETEQRKEHARKEKEAKEGPSESAKKKKAEDKDDSKRKRREPHEDKAYDPKQHTESLVKKEKDDEDEAAGEKKKTKKTSDAPAAKKTKKSASSTKLSKKAKETAPPAAAAQDASDILGTVNKDDEEGKDKAMTNVKVKKEPEDKKRKKKAEEESSSDESEGKDKKKEKKKSKDEEDKKNKSSKKKKDDTSSSSSSSESESEDKKKSKKSSKKDKK